MPANSKSIHNSDNIAIDDTLSFLNDDNSNHFVNRTGGGDLWQNATDKMKKLLETRKDLSSSVLDEITPPGNRLSHKSFSSNNQLNQLNNSAVSNIGVGFFNHSYNNNSDVYDHTPINGHRSEPFGNTSKSMRASQNLVPSSTPSYKTASIPTQKKNPPLSSYEQSYDMSLLNPPSDLLYQDSWPCNYPMGHTGGGNNCCYKPTPTPPNSIDEHVSMLGETFSRLSTGISVPCVDDSNFYGNLGGKDNTPSFYGSHVSKLPHPSLLPPTGGIPSSRQPPFTSNRDVNTEVTQKFHTNRSSNLPTALQHYPPQSSSDLYQVRPMYDFHRVDSSTISPSAGGGCIAANNPKPYISWIGKLSVKSHPDPIYSNKVFLGGLPWDITEQGLYVVFKQFGPCTFEWPGKDNRSTRHPPKGYVYLIFENERSVKTLLQYCHHDEHRTQFYFKLKTHTNNNEKSIQIIPWNLANSSYLKCSSERLDITKTVFVGGLHGKITAENLAVVFEELFGHVIYAGIDTDKNKYPIGSGRVTFDNFDSYRNAIQASFVQINGKNFCKKVQIDPYLEDSICQTCTQKNGPFFCKDFDCLQYFCKDCWIVKHCNPAKPQLINHRPINRQNSSDIFEILNSIQFYSQLSASSKCAPNGSQHIPPLTKSTNNISPIGSPLINNSYCPVAAPSTDLSSSKINDLDSNNKHSSDNNNSSI